jgi:AbrB family looped-hinge helix DNA binding protein
MSKTLRKNKCCPGNDASGNIKVESIVTIDDRGQMVLPKDIREKFGLRSGDKLALATNERNGKLCCIYLFKADDLVGTVKEKLGPLLTEVAGSR